MELLVVRTTYKVAISCQIHISFRFIACSMWSLILSNTWSASALPQLYAFSFNLGLVISQPTGYLPSSSLHIGMWFITLECIKVLALSSDCDKEPNSTAMTAHAGLVITKIN